MSFLRIRVAGFNCGDFLSIEFFSFLLVIWKRIFRKLLWLGTILAVAIWTD